MNDRNRRDFKCQECGKLATLRQAERWSCSNDGCPGCGGSDFDLNVPEPAGAANFHAPGSVADVAMRKG